MLIELQGANDLTKPTGTAAPLILQHRYTSLSAVQKQLQALNLINSLRAALMEMGGSIQCNMWEEQELYKDMAA